MTPSLHAINRAKERYRVELTLAGVLEIETLIEEMAEGVKLQRVVSKDRAIWWVPFQGKRLRVVFDAECRRVVTVLPLRDKNHARELQKGQRQPDNAATRKKKQRAFQSLAAMMGGICLGNEAR